eukprot:TRINITY_DN36597_c0_g2_i1.p1 TRINITY_DN36597_c0_g2~~TRINITY_DN36597_c0_g2_i1.p1  ORF type:complete len:1086 (+),score=209.24 TRINITY_DN36597_c0_g2_i1:60-3317(+)
MVRHAPATPASDKLASGDVLLFSRRCMSCKDMRGIGLCLGTKLLTNSRWTQTAVVISEPASHEPWILETSAKGIRFGPLSQRLERLSEDDLEIEVCVRRVALERTPELSRDLWAFAQDVAAEGANAPMHLRHLAPALVRAQSLPMYAEQLQRLQHWNMRKLREVDNALRQEDMKGPAMTRLCQERVRLQQRLQRLEESLRERLLPRAEDDFSKGVTGSHLAAVTLQRAGVLADFPPANTYIPRDFSSDDRFERPPRLHLADGIALLPEEKLAPARKSGTKTVQRWLEDYLEKALAETEMLAECGQGQAPDEQEQAMIASALRRNRLTASLTKEQLWTLSASFRLDEVATGSAVYAAGALGGCAYVVGSGQIERYQHNGPCRKQTAGESFGFSDAFNRTVRQDTAICASGDVTSLTRCRLWHCERDDLEHALAKMPEEPSGIMAPEEESLLRRVMKNRLHSHLFGDASREKCQELLPCFFPLTLAEGELLYKRGDTSLNVFILQEGTLEVDVPGRDPMCHAQPGTVFGDGALFRHSRRSSSVRAASSVKIWALPAESLDPSECECQALLEVFRAAASAKDDQGQPMMTTQDFVEAVSRQRRREAGPAHGLLQRLVAELAREGRPDAHFSLSDFARANALLSRSGLEVELAFFLADANKDGWVSEAEFRCFWRALLGDPAAAVPKLDGKTEQHSLDDFRDAFARYSRQKESQALLRAMRQLSQHWQLAAQQGEAMRSYNGEDDIGPVLVADFSETQATAGQRSGSTSSTCTFVATTAAVSMSRFVTAPLDRVKIIAQCLKLAPHDVGWGGYRGIYTMFRNEGWRSWFRGNSADFLRTVPQSVLQLAVFGQMQSLLLARNDGSSLGFPEPLSSGQVLLCSGVAGIAALSVVYPLDVVRARMAVQLPTDMTPQAVTGVPSMRSMWGEGRAALRGSQFDAKRYSSPTLQAALQDACRGIGPAGLYRGFTPMAMGTFIYYGLSVSLTKSACAVAPRRHDGSGAPNTNWELTATLWSTRIAQLACYPFDTLKRSMQASPNACHGVLAEATRLYRDGGIGGFWRGTAPTLCKIGPSVATTYLTYHGVRDVWPA